MPDPTTPPLFSREEANALLPSIRLRFERIFVAQANLRDLADALEAQGVNVYAGHFRPRADDSDDLRALKERFTQGIQRINDEVAAIHATGAVVKDINSGLIDFYGKVDDEVVFLCWQYGEPEIAHWHRLDEGFSGRVPLDRYTTPRTFH